MTRRLVAAFAAQPRIHFLPPDQQRFAAENRPLPIGHDATNSQPTTVHRMLELLDVLPGHQVLDVGCGSGWTTALLAELVDVDGHVVGTEIIAEVLALCAANLAGRSARIELHRADPAVPGWPAGAPYDRILLSANAPSHPTGLVAQLATDGVLVGPVRGHLLRIARRADAVPEITEHGRYSFVPLRTLDP